MTRIMLTGMCHEKDRRVSEAGPQGVKFFDLAPEIQSHGEVMEGFRIARNTGNYLISEGAEAALAGHEFEYLPFWSLLELSDDAEYFYHINKTYDVCVFVCANILENSLNLEDELRVLARLEIPVIYMSIGIQDIAGLRTDSASNKAKFIEHLKTSKSFCLTRGLHSAKFLRKAGVQNVFQACCPSVFYNSTQILDSVKNLLSGNFARAGNIYVNGYVGDGSLNTEKDLEYFDDAGGSVNYVFQDEPRIFGVLDNLRDDDRIYDDRTGRFLKAPACHPKNSERKNCYYRAYFSPERWRDGLEDCDFSTGRRFHGNLVALQAGKPAFFVAHDDRVEEMLNSVGLPYVGTDAWNQSSDKYKTINEYVKHFSFANFQDRYLSRKEDFETLLRSFLGAPA